MKDQPLPLNSAVDLWPWGRSYGRQKKKKKKKKKKKEKEKKKKKKKKKHYSYAKVLMKIKVLKDPQTLIHKFTYMSRAYMYAPTLKSQTKVMF